MNNGIYGFNTEFASVSKPLLGRQIRQPTIDPLLGFDPRLIEGISLWLDGADESSMTFINGLIAQWRDKSGFNRHFGQTVAENRMQYLESPCGGRAPYSPNGIRFVERLGVTNSLYATPLGGSAFVAYSNNTLGVWLGYSNGGATNGFTAFNGTSYDPVFRATRVPGSFSVPTAVAPYVFSYVVTPETQIVRINGTQRLRIASDFNNWYALTNRTWQVARSILGFACEVIQYDRPLIANDIFRIERYLSIKWGI